MPSFNDWLFGKKDRVKQRSLKTTEQQDLAGLMQEALTKGTGPFADIFGGFNEQAFNKGVVEPTLAQYKNKVLPQILERFVGGNQSGGSGMFKGLISGAGGMPGAADLQAQLAQLMYEAQNKQQQNRIQGAQNLLGQQMFENEYQKGHPGALAEFGTEVVKGLGKRIGSGNIFGGGDSGGGGGQSFNPGNAATAAQAVALG